MTIKEKILKVIKNLPLHSSFEDVMGHLSKYPEMPVREK